MDWWDSRTTAQKHVVTTRKMTTQEFILSFEMRRYCCRFRVVGGRGAAPPRPDTSITAPAISRVPRPRLYRLSIPVTL